MARHSSSAPRPAPRPSWSVAARPPDAEASPSTARAHSVTGGHAPTVVGPAAPIVLPAGPIALATRSGSAVSPGPSATATARPTRLARRRAHRRRRRLVAAVAVGALVVAITAVGGTIAAMAKTVTIAVDGTSRQITTLSDTVDGALAAAGLTVGAHDTLAPSGHSAIADGSRILVRRGRLVTVTIDGTPRRFWTTATTVEAALAQIGRNPADFKLSADRSRPIPLSGLSLTADTLRTVTLTAPDGGSVQLVTAATTVGELLADQGLAPTADQAVSPAPDTALADGMTVTVRALPTITLVRDGRQRAVVANATTVAGMLTAQGVPVTDATVVTPSLSSALASGMTVTVTELPTVTVTVGSAAPVTVIARQLTVADLLRARHISLGPDDMVRPSGTTVLADGMVVTVTRVTYSTTTKDVSIPQPPAVTTYSDLLDQGARQVTVGRPGIQRISYRVRSVNGVVGAPVETGRTTVTTAEPTVTVIGTGTAATATPTATSTSSAGGVQWVGNRVFFHDYSYGVNWDGLAHCESTNNPRAVAPSGRYFGLFQFDLSTWRSVGGTGNPIDAAPTEQLARAKALYLARGLSPWACAWAAH